MHDRLQPKFQANAVMLQHFVGHLKFLHFWNIQFDDHNTKKSFWQNVTFKADSKNHSHE